MLERVSHILSLNLKTTLQRRHNPHFTDEELRLGGDLPIATKLVGEPEVRRTFTWFPSKGKPKKNFKKYRWSHPKQIQVGLELPLPCVV